MMKKVNKRMKQSKILVVDGQRLTMFINEAVEARASRPAIKPQNHGIFGWISLGNNEVVEKILIIEGYIATS
jgi:hypothetical protein